MEAPWTEEKLKALQRDGVEERWNLEYKDGRAIARDDKAKTEITKDVSAMANADGGTIIYGIGEDPQNKHLPGTLTPIDRTAFSKEWIENVLQNIRPRIADVVIEPVPSQKSTNGVYYVITIPKATTAHQAADQKYYRRYNFKAEPMYDHEIRDVMNRRTVPRVEVGITVYLGKNRIENHVFCKMRNLSPVLAEHAALTIRMPIFIDGKYARFEGQKMSKGDDGFATWMLRPGSTKILFPEAEITWEYSFVFAHLSRWEGEQPASATFIEYVAFAGNMRPLRGRFELAERTRIQPLVD